MKLKKIGFVSGSSPKSTKLYYNKFNEIIAKDFGEKQTVEMLIKPLDFAHISKLRAEEKFNDIVDLFDQAIGNLINAGAEVIMVSTNSVLRPVIDMHNEKYDIPIVDIISETVRIFVEKKLNRVAVLGSKHIMTSALLSDLTNKFGVEFFLPKQEDRDFIYKNIKEELVFDVISNESRIRYSQIVDDLILNHQINAIAIGSVDLSHIISKEHFSIPVLNSVDLNVKTAIKYAMLT